MSGILPCNFRRHRSFVLVILTVAAIAHGEVSETAEPTWRLVVGPNILVSREGDFPHDEYAVAANPRDAKNLVAVSMALSETDGGRGGARTFSTWDSGSTWKPGNFVPYDKDLHRSPSADPQIAFDSLGVAYFVVLSDELSQNDEVITESRLLVYRSENGGATWLPPARLKPCDHPQMVVDTTDSPFAGRIYVSALFGHNGKDSLGLFYSRDGGRSFSGPIDYVIAGSRSKQALQQVSPMVMSDGTLVLPYFEYGVDDKTDTLSSSRRLKVVSSSDGGSTFSSPHDIAVQHLPAENPGDYLRNRLDTIVPGAFGPVLGGYFDFPGTPQFASNPHASKFKDRIYGVWADTQGDRNPRLVFSYSSDRGATWSIPQSLSADLPLKVHQYQPKIAVSDAGVVGVQWFDTRRSAREDSYDLYFTASVDGGESFLPERRITSEPSSPATLKHLTPGLVLLSREAGRVTLGFDTVYVSRSSGGDYMGLTADAAGNFHPVWADNRTHTFQLWTAKISPAPDLTLVVPDEKSAGRIVTGTDIGFRLDAIRYNDGNHKLVLPVRIQNISAHTLYAPMRIKVTSLRLWSSALVAAGFQPPRILNAANSKSGDGAIFDYSNAFGDMKALHPGEVSEAVVWLLEISKPGQSMFEITAEPTR